MASFLRAARPASAFVVAGTGAMAAIKFQPRLWQQPQVISCEPTAIQKVDKIEKTVSEKVHKTVSRTKSSRMNLEEAQVTHDTALYKAYEAKFGAKKTAQLSFHDIALLLKGIGIKNQYIASCLFRAMDEDHSGTVSFDEMNHFCHTLAMGTKQEKARFMFDACDTNSNGKVEVADMRIMVKNLTMTCHGTLPNYVLLKTEADVALCEDLSLDEISTLVSNRLCYQMFHDCDQKKSGVLTYKQFEQWIVRNLGAAHEFNDLFAVFDHLLAKH